MAIKKILALHLFVLALVVPQMGLAADFTFNVPVNASELHPDAQFLIVECEIGGAIAGIGQQGFPIPDNGVVNRTFTVTVDINSGTPATAALGVGQSYSCILKVKKQGTGPLEFAPSDSSTCNSPNNAFRCGKPGTPFTARLNGGT